jgi:hypothetical protein
MTAMEIFQLIAGSGGLVGLALIFFRTGKIVQKIESMEKKIDKIEENSRTQGERLARIEGVLHWFERIMFNEKAN